MVDASPLWSNDAPEAWAALCHEVRLAVLADVGGDAGEARRRLSDEVALATESWSQRVSLPTAAKQVALRDLFDAERRHAEEVWAVQRLVVKQVVAELQASGLPAAHPTQSGTAISQPGQAAPRKSSPAPLRQQVSTDPSERVPFDDISGMIDALIAAE